MTEIEPFSTIHSPQDKRSVAVPEPINEDDPRILAPNALDTLTYGTETPETQTPPTNYTVATEEHPPTEEGLEPVDAEPIEEPPPEGATGATGATGAFMNMTPDDRDPIPVWRGQPKVRGQEMPERFQPPHAIAHERPVYDDAGDDDDNEWVENHDAEKPKKKAKAKKK